MKILLSPAKKMDAKTQHRPPLTTPNFLDQAKIIHKELKKKSVEELMKLHEVSESIARENFERNARWENAEKIPAIFAFKGEVYRGLDAETLPESAWEYLQKNILILSGLYGVLRPFDAVSLYRLEMGTPLPVDGKKNLYEFWRETSTNYLTTILQPNEPILNLASAEYAKSIDFKQLNHRVVDVEFKEFRNGKLMSIMSYFKHARGTMARYCIENEIEDIEKVKNFVSDGYLFNEELSEENRWVFTR